MWQGPKDRALPPGRNGTNRGRSWPAALGQALAVCALMVLGAPALAEKADREKPINLEADRVSIDDTKQLAIFEGNVLLTQGTMQIRGERMEVRQDKEGFKYGTTWGSLAYFRQKRDGYDEFIEGWAERIEYDGRAETMQMFNRARMQRGQDEVRGNYISYDARTEFFRVTGAGEKPAGSASPEGRVRAVLQPKSKEQPPPSPPVSLKPAVGIAAPREESGAKSP